MVPNFPGDACKMWVTLLIVMLVRINVSSCAKLHCVLLRNWGARQQEKMWKFLRELWTRFLQHLPSHPLTNSTSDVQVLHCLSNLWFPISQIFLLYLLLCKYCLFFFRQMTASTMSCYDQHRCSCTSFVVASQKNATAQFLQKHPTSQRFFFPLQKHVYSANSGDVFSFTLSHHAAKRYQGQRNQTVVTELCYE